MERNGKERKGKERKGICSNITSMSL
jgi:hypothetical protein